MTTAVLHQPSAAPARSLLGPAAPARDRVVSLDALRGFDMFWIIGGDAAVKAVLACARFRYLGVVNDQLEHVEWQGFHFYDLIFPLFLFVVGVALPFSLGKLTQPGASPWAPYVRVLRRTALLFVLGLLQNGILGFDWADARYAGVLQRIAICYGVAALISLRTRWRAQAVIAAVLLVGYWALLSWVPAPGHAAGDLSKAGNLAGWVDRVAMPGKLNPEYYGEGNIGLGDNEGYLSTIPAVATTLLGLLAGTWLRSRRGPAVKTLGLALGGVVCLGLGWAWALKFPIIKILWTSSYVLWAGGWSLLLLALFYGVIDGLRWRWWAYFFVVIGSNAILIYVAQHFVDFGFTAERVFGGVAKLRGDIGPAVMAVGELAVKWVLLWWLYRNKLFLRA